MAESETQPDATHGQHIAILLERYCEARENYPYLKPSEKSRAVEEHRIALAEALDELVSLIPEEIGDLF